MSLRLLSHAIVVLACLIAGAAARAAQSSPEPAKPVPAGNNTPATPIEFYLAHGDPDACGPGCDEWIAAEGKIDIGAADRLRRLLAKLHDRRPPVYFYSPGGSIGGSLALGRLIRARQLPVSVAHTLPLGCQSDKPLDKACDSQKRSGQAVEAAFDPTVSMCNSACVYGLAGGAVRLVPPWVKLGIHEAAPDPKAKPPRGVSLAAVMRVTHARIRGYLREMGFDDALFAAAVATPNTSVRMFQRDELVRFGIDRRGFAEATWQYVEKSAPAVRKLFFVGTDADEPRYRNGLISIGCGTGPTMRVAFARELLASDPSVSGRDSSTVNVSANGKRIIFYRVASPKTYIRLAQVPPDALDPVGDDAKIELPGTELGRKEGPYSNVRLSLDQFSAAYAKLRARCPNSTRTAQAAVPVQTVRIVQAPIEGAAKSPGTSNSLAVPAATVAESHPVESMRILELTRVTAAEQKLRLDFLHRIQPDCSSAGETVVRVYARFLSGQHRLPRYRLDYALRHFAAGRRRDAALFNRRKVTLGPLNATSIA